MLEVEDLGERCCAVVQGAGELVEVIYRILDDVVFDGHDGQGEARGELEKMMKMSRTRPHTCYLLPASL